MAKSKKQKREEALQRQNAYRSHSVEIPSDMPFLCGGYTQSDWDLLTRANWTLDDMENWEYMWESCESLEEQYDFLTEEYLGTKPYWA